MRFACSGWSSLLAQAGSISMEEFWPMWLGGGPGGCDYVTHLLSWYARRNEPDTLLASYRWAAKNRPAMIARLAAFMGLELTPEQAAQQIVRGFARGEFDIHFPKRFSWPLKLAALLPYRLYFWLAHKVTGL